MSAIRAVRDGSYSIEATFPGTSNLSRLKSKILTMKNRDVDGLLGCFESDNDNLSYVKIDKTGFVKQVKEKEKISSNASTGLYVFTNAKQFFQAAEEMIKKNIKVRDEFYVSEIYNILLNSGGRFEIDIADEFIPLGTPDDIRKNEV